MTQISIQRRRTGWDIVWGILLFIGGLVVLGDVVLATVVSMLFIGWVTLISGIVGIIASLFMIGKGGAFWSALISGALMTVLGLLFLRNPVVQVAALLVFTAVAAMIFLVSGIVRVVAGFENTSARWALIISGLASIILGVIVLFNFKTAAASLLGILIGVQLLIDGLTIVMFGRVRVTTTAPATV